MRSTKIYIILLNWNGKKDTIECLSSLAKVDFTSFQPLVVDNGSTDGSVAEIRVAFPDVPILKTGENLGFAEGNNRGIEWALSKRAEWILLLNNDTVVSPDFLTAFMEASKLQPKAKILGAKIYRYSEKNTIDHLGGFWNPKIGEFESPSQNQIDDGNSFEEMEKVETVCGAALLMHRSVPETIGLLEPRFFLFWEETDFCTRARRSGFEVWTAPQAKIWHKVSSSFVGGKPHMHYFWWRSRLLWIERNCPFNERKQLYKKVIFPELWKHLRHCTLKSIQSLLTKNPAAKQKALRYRAGLAGALHYTLSRFGNCPKWLVK
jgi:GT2 family glycosyltransferase